MNTFDPQTFRNSFPCFQTNDLGIYLDNAATTQLPEQVIAMLNSYYLQGRSNVHRSSHPRAQMLTDQFEQARETVAQWLNVAEDSQIIWTSGTTASLNMLAYGLQGQFLPGQKVLVSTMEHHANLLPWQRLCQHENLRLEIIPVTSEGELDWPAYEALLDDSTAIVAVAHVSNSLGTCNDVAKICHLAKTVGAISIIDGAQAVAHLPVDLNAIGCDAYAFSGHKMYAPSGVGVLYGRSTLLKRLHPLLLGGEMVKHVSFNTASFRELPFTLEAGTPNIAGVLGLAEAVEFLKTWDNGRYTYEQNLLNYTYNQLHEIDGLRLLGAPKQRCGVLAFEVQGIHPFDITAWLNEQRIAIRCGHHCAIPLTEQFTQQGSIRVSLAAYNTIDEINYFIEQLKQAIDINRL
ncbi:aminotransferase class V-fold PLP-dependent enzyme [Celerinatantimonas sp. YJH-8]|uniref:aminotransferase class V-fold PLP-dependent enzyme n=1 Tax=Celerinatantimonas sp. YJH-8 TaxID=3228714 RepID=UPI0038C4764A